MTKERENERALLGLFLFFFLRKKTKKLYAPKKTFSPNNICGTCNRLKKQHWSTLNHQEFLKRQTKDLHLVYFILKKKKERD